MKSLPARPSLDSLRKQAKKLARDIAAGDPAAIADFLLAHGADIDTNWNSHEPASILHALVFEDNYESMQYVIDRGIDMSIKDYRWDSDAIGWARYGKKDEKMAQWLEEADQRRTRMKIQ